MLSLLRIDLNKMRKTSTKKLLFAQKNGRTGSLDAQVMDFEMDSELDLEPGSELPPQPEPQPRRTFDKDSGGF